jgi:hypothetical protein
MASTAPVFLYEALAPLGEEEETWDSAAPAVEQSESLGLGFSFKEDAHTLETSTSFHTIRQRLSKQKLIADHRMETTTEDLQKEACPSDDFLHIEESNGEGISGLGLHETEVSVSEKMEVNSCSIESAETVEDAGYLSLNLMEDNVETMVEGRLRVMGKKMVTVESLNISRREAPPWAQSRSGHETWFRSPLLQLHQGSVHFCFSFPPCVCQGVIGAI